MEKLMGKTELRDFLGECQNQIRRALPLLFHGTNFLFNLFKFLMMKQRTLTNILALCGIYFFPGISSSSSSSDHLSEVYHLSGEPDYRFVTLRWQYPKHVPTLNGFQVRYCELQAWGPNRCRTKMIEASAGMQETIQSSPYYTYSIIINGLRMATNYTFEVQPMETRRVRYFMDNKVNHLSRRIIIPTKGYNMGTSFTLHFSLQFLGMKRHLLKIFSSRKSNIHYFSTFTSKKILTVSHQCFRIFSSFGIETLFIESIFENSNPIFVRTSPILISASAISYNSICRRRISDGRSILTEESPSPSCASAPIFENYENSLRDSLGSVADFSEALYDENDREEADANEVYNSWRSGACNSAIQEACNIYTISNNIRNTTTISIDQQNSQSEA
ncbi:hypothetical protein LSTR_LSTR010022 [Laodelphax striatellus]|uniref:Uncharacterized protein n=1 Tax=Laodelphax striatellus TaxID=195883 RepID=A0A482WP69_LAOST|nr:hypothetical protein LSTR_LSTR010022 [Laodelphax striatellus]